MHKKTTWLISAMVLLTLPLAARAQQANKIPVIGYFSPFHRAKEASRADRFRRALRERGYAVGENIAIEYRYAEGKIERAPNIAADLVGLKVDVIVVAGGAPWIKAVKNATTTIPIVILGGGSDPVEEGLVESLASPGGNITGISNLSRELGGKRLELLKEAIPKLGRVAVVYDPAIPAFVNDVKRNLPVAAKALGLMLQPWEIRAERDFEKVFAALKNQRPDGLYFPPGGPLTFIDVNRVVSLAIKLRLPAMYITSTFVDAGGLMSYGADQAESYQRVAYFVDRILKGAKPADLPVEQPMRFELVVNLKTAKVIDVKIDPNLLARATRLIR